jgi:outer membrane lipoprotein-sorting protein
MLRKSFPTGALFFVLILLLCPMATAADDLSSVIARLNAAAKDFHTTSADVEFDSTQTNPVPDTDVQKGVVYYERSASSTHEQQSSSSTFQMGVHIASDDGQSAPKVVVCCAKGSIQLYEKLADQVTTLSKLSQYESWFMLGFGASGKELEEKWDITYDGPETVDDVETAKLELVPKDPTVRKNLPKVILWMDVNRAVSLKQYFDEGNGQSRTCHYTNIKVNGSLPKDAFTFKTDSKTTYTTH